MMKQKNKLLLLAVFSALVIPLLLVGNAGAISLPDGSKPDNTTGLWAITDYGQCISGIDNAGKMYVATAHNGSRADCIDFVYTSSQSGNYDNALGVNNCLRQSGRSGDAAADNVSHYWASTCVAPNGTGISLYGLDRTSQNCILKGGTYKSACTNSWVYTGSGPAYTSTLGTGGQGFCYTTIDVTSLYGTQALCPTNVLGYSWNTTSTSILYNKCAYNYGIAGILAGNITKKGEIGTDCTVAGTSVDLGTTADNTMGKCMNDGYSWSTGVTAKRSNLGCHAGGSGTLLK